MAISDRIAVTFFAAVAVIALSGGRAFTQADASDPARNNLPNPTQTVVKDWGKLPEGRV